MLTEQGSELMSDIASRSRRFQVEGLNSTGRVSVHLGTMVEALGAESAVLWNGTKQWTIEGIELVTATRPVLPVTECSEALYAHPSMPPVYMVGDCARPRTALEAMHDAAALAHRL